MRMSCASIFLRVAVFLLAPQSPVFASELCHSQPAAILRLWPDTGGRVSIYATINGNPTALTLDTGGWFSMLDWNSANSFDLPIRSSIHWMRLLGGIRSRLEAEPDDLRLEMLPISGLKFAVLPQDSPGVSAVRTIGADALNRFDVDLDLAANNIKFYSRDECGGPFLPPTGSVFVAPQAKFTDGHQVLVAMTLDGKPLTAVLDTGSTRTVMNLKAANDIFGVTLQDTSLVWEKPVLINGILPSAAYRYPFKLLTLAAWPCPIRMCNCSRRRFFQTTCRHWCSASIR